MEIEAVDLLPHFGTDALTHLTGIVTRCRDTRGDRVAVGHIEGQRLSNRVGGDASSGELALQRQQQATPAPLGGGWRQIERAMQMHIKQARRVLSALQIARHPEETVGDPAEHWRFRH